MEIFETKSEQAREAARARWDKVHPQSNRNADEVHPQSDRNASKVNKSKVNNINISGNKKLKTVSPTINDMKVRVFTELLKRRGYKRLFAKIRSLFFRNSCICLSII